MAAYRERQQNADENRRLRYQTYIEGSAVRKTAQAAPLQNPENEREREKRRAFEEKKAKEAQSIVGFKRGMDFMTVALLGIALCIILTVTLKALKVNAEVTELNKEITNLTKQYDTLRSENDSALNAVADDINLNEVYEIAVGKLGMVYPNHNQVIEFECVGNGYVRQYGEVPEAADEGNIDTVTKVLRRLLR